jgi:hypothetical protein
MACLALLLVHRAAHMVRASFNGLHTIASTSSCSAESRKYMCALRCRVSQKLLILLQQQVQQLQQRHVHKHSRIAAAALVVSRSLSQ